MFKSLISFIIIVYTTLAPLIATANASDLAKAELIKGTWNCKINVALVGMNMSIIMQNTFANDHTAIGQGLVKVTNYGIGMDLAYDVKVAQTWFVKEGILYQTITASAINSLKSSFYESLYDTNSLLPAGQQEATKIVSINESNFLGLYNGMDLYCDR